MHPIAPPATKHGFRSLLPVTASCIVLSVGLWCCSSLEPSPSPPALRDLTQPFVCSAQSYLDDAPKCVTRPGVVPPTTISGASTTRVTQMSGDSDYDGLFHVNRTGWWSAPGIDLGASVDHDGRTFVLFGDSPKANVADPRNDMDPVAYLEDIHVAPGTRLAAATPTATQTDLFYIGADGALYVLWSNAGEAWRGPQRLSARRLAPAGAPIATALQTSDQLDVFVVGNDGGIYVAWSVANGPWSQPLRITNTGVAPVGAPLAADKPTSTELDVFFVDANGALARTWVTGSGAWVATPQAVTANGMAPAAAHVVAAHQDSAQLDVFFVGNYGQPIVVWARDGVGWSSNLHQLSGSCLTPAGAPLALGVQNTTQLDLFTLGNDGGVCVAWLPSGADWSGPSRITPVGTAPAAGALAASPQAAGQLDVAFVKTDGAVAVTRSTGWGPWSAPESVTTASHAAPGASLIASKQMSNQLSIAYVGTDAVPSVSWVIGSGSSWLGPAHVSSDTFMTPVWDAGAFYPFTLSGDGPTHHLATPQTPTGAFSWDGKLYSFVVEIAKVTLGDASFEEAVYSSLASSATPEASMPFQFVFRMSGSKTVKTWGKFFQVAPVVVANSEVPGLPSSNGQGVVLFGHGWDNAGVPAVHLAWMPLVSGLAPTRASVRFYTGSGWSSDEADAAPIIPTQWGWTSVSAQRLAGRWIVMTQMGQLVCCHAAGGFKQPLRERIVAHFADTPMAIAATTPHTIFDPDTAGAYGHWMHDPTLSTGQNTQLDDSETFTLARQHPSFAYGAFFVGSRSRVATDGTVTLEYLMSTGRPYAVHLMKTTLPSMP